MELSHNESSALLRARAPIVRRTSASGHGAFGAGWIVLEHAGGTPPSLGSFPFAAAGLRDALLAAAPSSLDVMGLAIVPLADVGRSRSNGALYGAGIVPRNDFRERAALVATLETLLGEGRDGPALHVPFGPLAWMLRPSDTSRGAALQPERWLGFSAGGGSRPTATTWASATPLMLRPGAECETWIERERSLQRLIERACSEAGLPLPRRVFSSPVSPIRGTRAVPKHRRARTLTHAVLEFAYPICGPLILGRGPTLGLGLCLPLPARA